MQICFIVGFFSLHIQPMFLIFLYLKIQCVFQKKMRLLRHLNSGAVHKLRHFFEVAKRDKSYVVLTLYPREGGV